MVDVIDRGEAITRSSTIRRAIRRKESRVKKLQCAYEEAEIRGDQAKLAVLFDELKEAKEQLVYQQSRLEQLSIRI